MVEAAKKPMFVNLEASNNVKQLHTMLGHTGYYRKFIKSYSQITAPMEKLLKKDATFCWDEQFQQSLDVLKDKMVTAPILVFSYWKKEFHVHVDASCTGLGAVLNIPDEGDIDHPIEFANHLSRIEIGEEPTNIDEGLLDVQLFVVRIANDNFVDIIYFLTTGTTLEGYSTQQKKELVVYAVDFSIIVGHLYKMGTDEILRRYVPELERASILAEAHEGVAGGHYVGRETMHKILCAGLWWPTIHKDSKGIL
eukprot:PITA_29644